MKIIIISITILKIYQIIILLIIVIIIVLIPNNSFRLKVKSFIAVIKISMGMDKWKIRN